MSKAIFKFNNGNLALLCSRCRKVIKEGKDFTEEEWKAVRNTHNNPDKSLPAQYCLNCKIDIMLDFIPFGIG